jgi:hypothetical protein
MRCYDSSLSFRSASSCDKHRLMPASGLNRKSMRGSCVSKRATSGLLQEEFASRINTKAQDVEQLRALPAVKLVGKLANDGCGLVSRCI